MSRELSEIAELVVNCGLSRFDGRTDPHSHFWCDRCDLIFDIDVPMGKKLNSKLRREKGFEVSDYRLLLHGMCPECRDSSVTK